MYNYNDVWNGDYMKVRDNFILKKIAGSFVVVPVRTRAVDFSGIIKLSESGAMLWELLAVGAERDDLIAKLLAEYDVDEAKASADVDSFIGRLQEADLLE